jgi:hypothetical protein
MMWISKGGRRRIKEKGAFFRPSVVGGIIKCDKERTTKHSDARTAVLLILGYAGIFTDKGMPRSRLKHVIHHRLPSVDFCLVASMEGIFQEPQAVEHVEI